MQSYTQRNHCVRVSGLCVCATVRDTSFGTHVETRERRERGGPALPYPYSLLILIFARKLDCNIFASGCDLARFPKLNFEEFLSLSLLYVYCNALCSYSIILRIYRLKAVAGAEV